MSTRQHAQVMAHEALYLYRTGLKQEAQQLWTVAQTIFMRSTKAAR